MATKALTPNMQIAFDALCGAVESTTEHPNGDVWGCAYLSNARPKDWPRRKWAAVLGALKKAGLYRDIDLDDFKGDFGDVKLQ